MPVSGSQPVVVKQAGIGSLAREVSSIYWPFLLSEKVSEMSLMGQAFPFQSLEKNALFAMD